MEMSSIPVVDIAQLDSRNTMKALDGACRDWGLFQVIRHGIDAATITALSDTMRAFFAQPTAVKRQISRTADNPWGYFDRELTKNKRDWKQIYDFGPASGNSIRPQWPCALPEFRSAVRNYYDECEQLARRLLCAISANLGMPRDYLDRGFGPDHTSFLRLNYYPPCPATGDATSLQQRHLGINDHTDAGALTLLLQASLDKEHEISDRERVAGLVTMAESELERERAGLELEARRLLRIAELRARIEGRFPVSSAELAPWNGRSPVNIS